jgi:hypothetical protein
MAVQSKTMTIVGWVISALIAALMTFSATLKVAKPPGFAEEFVNKFGYPEDLLVILAVAEITCVMLYLIPQTSILGAVMTTGYLGGAIATHARVEDNFIPAAIVGVMVWVGIYLREPRVRALLPLRQNPIHD